MMIFVVTEKGQNYDVNISYTNNLGRREQSLGRREKSVLRDILNLTYTLG